MPNHNLALRPRAQQDELLRLGKAYYHLDNLVQTLRTSQEMARKAGVEFKELATFPHTGAVLHEIENLAGTYATLAKEYFERFQGVAFAFLEEELGIADIRDEYLHLTPTAGTRKRSLPPYQYVRLDFDPLYCEPGMRIFLHVSDDMQFNACPSKPTIVDPKDRAHYFIDNPFLEEKWNAKFI